MAVVTADIGPGVRGGPVSLDGYAAGPNQSEDLPFGEGVDGRLHTWMFDHADENRAEIDGIVNAGAYILGRNMFGPGRGDWDLDWKGWWGPEPPYHAPVFVLTHHRREPLEMGGDTTFTSSPTDPSPPLRRPSGPRGMGGWRSQAAQPPSTSTCRWARSTSFAFTSCRSRLARVNASSTASAA